MGGFKVKKGKSKTTENHFCSLMNTSIQIRALTVSWPFSNRIA